MLNKVKLALRRKTDSLNEEIQECIDACYRDMARVGIAVFDSEGNLKNGIEAAPLIISCQKLYARWQFNFENAADRYRVAYESTRDGMSLCEDYTKQDGIIPGSNSGETPEEGGVTDEG